MLAKYEKTSSFQYLIENGPDMRYIYIVNDCCLARNQQCFSYITARTSYFFIEIIMRPALYKTNKPSVFSMVLPHWNNSPLIHRLPHSVTLSRFRTSQNLLFQLKAVYFWEAMNTNCIVFGLTRSGLEPTIYALEASTLTNDPVIYMPMVLDIGLSDWTVVYLMCKLECCKTFVTSNS